MSKDIGDINEILSRRGEKSERIKENENKSCRKAVFANENEKEQKGQKPKIDY